VGRSPFSLYHEVIRLTKGSPRDSHLVENLDSSVNLMNTIMKNNIVADLIPLSGETNNSFMTSCPAAENFTVQFATDNFLMSL
jgi:hypothetical protein